MKRLMIPVGWLLLVLVMPVASWQHAPNVVNTDPLSPAKEKEQFQLPAGYEVQLVASEPDIYKPMNLAFDDQGRLWVTDTLEYPYPARPGVKPRDTVKVLEDFGPDGKAGKITTFADGLNIPIGLLPLPGARPRESLVFSIPNIYRFRDTTGNGRADQREVAYGTYGYRDTHGMTNAFLHSLDGWIYACHGFANRSELKGSDGKVTTLESGNTYRMKLDGSHLEQYTWGQVNPFGLAMDSWGYLYTSDCHSEPIYQLIRGGYYPSFGKPHDGLGFAPQMFTRYSGSTAVAGIAYYAADAFPVRDQQTAFVGDVMTNQIVQFRMSWEGASPKATQHVLLQSKDQWFRPVDVKLGPDGALYIADFYNRIIGHYEVPLNHPGRDRHRGRIWRIVYKGKDVQPTPVRANWNTASVKELLEDLGHPNLVVRLFATHQLVHRGGKEIIRAVQEEARREGSGPAQAHALWVLHRLGALDEATLKQAASAKADLVRVHGARILAERVNWSASERQLALAGLKDVSPHVRRASAEAIGQHADAENVAPLLELRHEVPAGDTHLLHTVRIALRNQLRRAEVWKSLNKPGLAWKDAQVLVEVALGVASPEAAAFILGHLQKARAAESELDRKVEHIARYGKETTRKSLLEFLRGRESKSLVEKAVLLRAVERGMQQGGAPLLEEARAWGTELTEKLLGSTHPEEIRQGVELTRILRLEAQQKRLVDLVRSPTTAASQRGAVMDALFALDAGKYTELMGTLLTEAALPVETREHAARLLAQVNQPAQRAKLVTALPTAPARLQNSIAMGLASTAEGADALLQSIAAGKASARLLQEKAILVRLEATRLPGLKERLSKLTSGLPAADVKLTQLLSARRKAYLAGKPEVAKGAALFEKNCANCHQLAGKGAKIGPQLDGIGLRGLDRLLEDTLDPNRNVDEAFRTTRLVLISGKVLEGLFLREEGAVLILADAQGKEVRVPKKEVEERTVSPLSPMPANFGEQIGEVDFVHLLAYLLAQKPNKP